MLTRRTFLQASLLATAPALAQEKPLLLPAKAVTKGPNHHWFGYYDKCPWDRTGSYILAMESDFADRQPTDHDRITLGYVDSLNDNRFVPFDTTLAWSWQQGTMLQWLGNDVIYNSVKDGAYVATIRSLRPGPVRTLPRPIYAVSPDGTQAVTLDFARLHRLRPGYGYAAIQETHADEPAPKDLGIWHLNLATGKDTLIVSLAQLAANQPDDRFPTAEHWVNHLQFNPGGTRFVFLHRWKRSVDKSWHTRIYTAKPDGSDLKLLHDSGMISHFDWRDDTTLLAWAKLKRGEARNAFLLLDVNGKPPEIVFESETVDGHCSYSPDRKWVLNDTYPDKDRNQHLMLMNVKTGRRHSLNKFVSPKQYTGPVRCDLHPRWNRDGTKVCFDGCHDDQRQVYVVDVKDVVG